jgi:hypothetical protein
MGQFNSSRTQKMIDEYELYHGAVLRRILASCGEIKMKIDDRDGRVDSFVLNDRFAIHIKHSRKRMAPWQFTFSKRNIEELIDLDARYDYLFICLVCATDGIVVLTPQEFLEVTGPSESDVFWIRIDRTRNTMYSLFGNDGNLSRKISRGIGRILEIISPNKNE